MSGSAGRGGMIALHLSRQHAQTPQTRPCPAEADPAAAVRDTLDMVHGIRELHARRGKGRALRLWPWSRMTGWRAVDALMQAAGLEGVPASPKGLRHGFEVAAVTAASRSTWCRNGSSCPAQHHRRLR